MTAEQVNSVFFILWPGNNVKESLLVKKRGVHYKKSCALDFWFIYGDLALLRKGIPRTASHCCYFLVNSYHLCKE